MMLLGLLMLMPLGAANNPETQAFAESYRETTLVEGKGEDYDFLQNMDEDDGADSEEEHISHRRIKEKIQAYDRQEQIRLMIRREEAERSGREMDIDEDEVSLQIKLPPS